VFVSINHKWRKENSTSNWDFCTSAAGTSAISVPLGALILIGQPVTFSLGPERSSPPRLSIIVLPFANLAGDPEQESFVDGVTESLTTDLSRIRSGATSLNGDYGRNAD
jgi:hypothetical protein